MTAAVTTSFLGYERKFYVITMTQAKEAKPYDYFAAPDGDEVLDKALHVLKPATLIGLGLSVIDTLCYSYPKGYLATFGRYKHTQFTIIFPREFACHLIILFSGICM